MVQYTADRLAGAGKSTLIKMLIELRSRAMHEAAPVTGSVDHTVPTSGNVHLYPDPQSCSADYPILYADCEGLEGGEKDQWLSKQNGQTAQALDLGSPVGRLSRFEDDSGEKSIVLRERSRGQQQLRRELANMRSQICILAYSIHSLMLSSLSSRTRGTKGPLVKLRKGWMLISILG